MDISRLEAPYEITSIDPWLGPHAGDIELRMNRFKEKRWQIAGGAETFFGKSKATTIDKKLSKATTIVAIVFVVLVLVSYLAQNNDSAESVPVVDSSYADTTEIAG